MKMMKWTHSAGTGEIVVIILIIVVSSGSGRSRSGRLLQLYICIYLKKCMKHNKICHLQLSVQTKRQIKTL